MPRSLTILVVARDAAATIERAVTSCLPEADCPIVLVDDHSADDTAARARACGGSRLRIITAPDPGGVAVARQTALDAVETPFAAWLDADDQWLPGRATRLVTTLERGYDVASEAIELYDGPTGQPLRTLVVPAFLKRPGGAIRLFERNFLPGDTQVAFRTASFRAAGGYDPNVCGPESFDVLLRALAGGARFAFGDAVGYRMYAYPGSLSRDLTRQRAALTAALRRHDYAVVRALYRSAGYDERIATWALVMLAQFRDEPARALEWLDEASPRDGDPHVVLEPDGPWPQPEGWRRAFLRGTLLLQLGDAERAVSELARAESLWPAPESANNLGVAYARTGRRAVASKAFTQAAERLPNYRDARLNLADSQPSQLTTHPLRRHEYRAEYA